MSFFPLDQDLFTSSLWLEGTPEERCLWIWLIANRDQADGVVRHREIAIAAGARLSRPVIEAALAKFEAPDPDSRTRANDGRRIDRTEDGFVRILNHELYLNKDYSTPRWRKWKERKDATNALANAPTVGKRVANEEQVQEQTNTPKPPTGGSFSTEAVTEVFEHWREVMGHPTAKQTPGRRRHVGARLKEGYTPAQLCEAIDGCRLSLFHMGANESQSVFDDLTLICRNGEKVEFFRAKAAVPQKAEPGRLLTPAEWEAQRKEAP